MSNLNNMIKNLPNETTPSKDKEATKPMTQFGDVSPEELADRIANAMQQSTEVGKSEEESVQADVGSSEPIDIPKSSATSNVVPLQQETPATPVVHDPVPTPQPIVEKAAEVVNQPVAKEDDSESPVPFLSGLVENSYVGSDNAETGKLLKSLGMAAKRDIKVLQLAKTNSRPLAPIPVVDNSGRISDIINSFQEEYGIVVVPRSITNIPEWVTPRDHYVFEHENEYFFAPRDVEAVSPVINRLIEEILVKLESGALVFKDMVQVFQCNGVDVKTLVLPQEGLAEISTLLSNYGARLVTAGEWSLSMVVGDYIQVK